MKIRRSAGPHFVTHMLQLEIVAEKVELTRNTTTKSTSTTNLHAKIQLYTILGNQTTNRIKQCVYKSRTRRAVSSIKRREPDVRYVTLNINKFLRFLRTKDLAPFSYKWSVYSHWHMLSRANSANVGFRPVVRLFAAPANPTHAPRTENPFYKFGNKLLWVSTMYAQILWFSRV